MFFSNLKIFNTIKIYCLAFLLVLTSNPDKVQANNGYDEFPEFPHIRKNVDFWEKIYSTYSINTAVIHDQNDLTKIYEVVPLVDNDLPEARTINNNRSNTIKEKYSRILLRLASGSPPETRDEYRVANMFQGPSAKKTMLFAAENIRAQNGQKERFLEGVARSAAYLNRIREIFREQGLPTDLAYLPHVESSFNVQAYSKAGAAGLWQFTRSTGQQYMRIDHQIDERRDPLISTRAAAQLLKKNYETLGSWPLALTAYNYGTSGMVRAAQSHGSYENIFSHYDEGYFKFASRNFYSEFLAARKVARKLAGSPPQKEEKSYKMHYSHSVRHVDSRYSTANRNVSQPVKYAFFQVSRSDKQTGKFVGSDIRIRTYTVKNGDTAYSIAKANNLTAEKLCRANNINPKATLRSGQNLKIPARSPEEHEKSALQSTSSGKKQPAVMTNDKKPLPRQEDVT